MSSIQQLRVLINQRLVAAAEEIFEAVRKTIAGYEEELLLSRQELRRHRGTLKIEFKPELHPDRVADQPQLALSVWDEDFPSDQQLEWSSSLDQDQQAAPQEKQEENQEENQEANQEENQEDNPEENQEELEEDSTIRFIFTHQSSSPSAKADEGKPLPSTSAEQDQEKTDDDDDDDDDDDAASIGSSTANSDEDWRASMDSQSEDSDSKRDKTKKKKVPRLPMVPKQLLNKQNKSRISCKVCSKAFHAIVSLVNHMEVHSKDVCGVCGERFDNDESFRIHLKTHVKAEICSLCGKCFGGLSSLETHMRIHTGEKPFNCSECGKSFNCRHNMMRHIRIHTGERPYTCTVCRKSFNDYSTLKRHLMVHIRKINQNPNNTDENVFYFYVYLIHFPSYEPLKHKYLLFSINACLILLIFIQIKQLLGA
ncbi:zinc finger protein 80-like isoform X2 [Amphiprion ocellaris]|uniref:zinc finger protein 80-like isoform X2 n=1 Tax=Amphiprion ocellaris TaxID=80972 RepID=UPI0024118366|nr:zinc finger protein 80-like isoform X2 [Amphiprion ocellaris]